MRTAVLSPTTAPPQLAADTIHVPEAHPLGYPTIADRRLFSNQIPITSAVGIIVEYRFLPVASVKQMVERSGEFDPRFASHALTSTNPRSPGKPFLQDSRADPNGIKLRCKLDEKGVVSFRWIR